MRFWYGAAKNVVGLEVFLGKRTVVDGRSILPGKKVASGAPDE